MRYNKNFIQLNHILKNVLVKYDLNNLNPERKLVQQWPDMVGRELSECFVPKYVRDEILYLEIGKAMDNRQLKDKKKKLLQILANATGSGSIKDVEFI